jgi:predicted kinase|tara:strand:- start:3 stop:689 length:687 start_codon:yes stop_codon:yes gene_type:complete
MKLNSFAIQINEGLYDPGIFKAFFLAGGPGSGKSFVTASAFAGTGLKLVNSDLAFEKDLKKAGLSLKMPDEEEYFRNIIRQRAKKTAITQLDTYIRGRLGLVIDSTGRDYDVIARNASMLKQLGYDCYMVFVNTSLEVALERNKRRERSIPEYITTNSWNGVQNNIGKFQRLFGMNNFLVVDNNKSDLELTTLTMNRVGKEVRRLIRAPISSYIAKRWMASERKAKRR